MHKVNYYHSELLNQAKAHGLDLERLRKRYGLPFVIKLFKYIKKESLLKKPKIDPIFPERFLADKILISDYIVELEDSGFPMKTWVEDFIDEDTGEIVGIQRFVFKPLKTH